MLLHQVRELLDEFAAQRQSSFNDNGLTSRLAQAARTPVEKLLPGERGVKSKDAVEGGRYVGRNIYGAQYGCVNGWEIDRDAVSEYYWHMGSYQGEDCITYVQKNHPSATGATWGSNGCFAEFGQTRTYYNNNYKNCLFDTPDYRAIASRIESQGAHTCIHGYEVGHLSEYYFAEVATDLSTLDECIAKVKSVCNDCQGASFDYARGICFKESVTGGTGSPYGIIEQRPQSNSPSSYFEPPSTSETSTYLHQGCTFPRKKPKYTKCRCKSQYVCYGLECEGDRGVCISSRRLTDGRFIGQCTEGDPRAIFPYTAQASSVDYGNGVNPADF